MADRVRGKPWSCERCGGNGPSFDGCSIAECWAMSPPTPSALSEAEIAREYDAACPKDSIMLAYNETGDTYQRFVRAFAHRIVALRAPDQRGVREAERKAFEEGALWWSGRSMVGPTPKDEAARRYPPLPSEAERVPDVPLGEWRKNGRTASGEVLVEAETEAIIAQFYEAHPGQWEAFVGPSAKHERSFIGTYGSAAGAKRAIESALAAFTQGAK